MVAFLLSAVVASIFAPVSESNAQTVTVENRATGYFVSVTSPDTVELEVDATPTGSTVISDASTINVVTNAPGGYKLYLSAEDNELKSDNSGISQTFKPVTSTSLTNNTWGYSLDSGSSKNWFPVPSVPLPEVNGGNTTESYMETKGASLISGSNTSNYPTGTDIDIYYGINADTTMPSGTYTTTVTYTAFAEGIPAIYTMQGFTIQECANMDTDEQTQLLDTRNNRTYTIVKARDGNCWMAENLSIYNTTISSEDSNLPEGTTITLPDSSNWDTNDTTNMRIHVADGTGQYADKTVEYYGEVYYNWCASIGEENCGKYNVAGTTINQSICPKGWRLPVDGDTTVDKSYAKLMNAYSITTGAQLLTQTNLGFKYYGHWNWLLASEASQGVYGSFWSSTARSGDDTYALYYSSTELDSRYNHNKGHGFSVRCVQENRTLSDVAYMQDVYDQICANTATGATTQLLDKRGQGNNGTNTTAKYGVLKAKDGNCWMTSNLNLYNKALTPNDTDIPSNITLPASTNWTTNDNTNLRIHVGTNSGYVGEVYYNWCSSIGKAPCNEGAGVTVNQSICPKNWRLPINGNANTDKSWAKLMNIYGITTGPQLVAQTSLGFTKYYGNWDWNQAIEINQGYRGHFWSSTAYSYANAYFLVYDSTAYGSAVDPQYNHYKGFGFSVRCVLR